ncbi:MAG: thioredoxin family protein [Ignavibacteriae bacterium]|nr:thioredoxin family protein [Ignavibacteriota bacterium]
MKQLIVLTLLLPLLAFAGELKYLRIGEEVPSFTLKNVDGKTYTLDSIKKQNKFTVLMYIATECPVSNAYNERMVKLYDTFLKRGVAFVGINSNKQETVDAIATHSKKNSFQFPVLKDEKNIIADAYGAQVTPEVFVINPQGKLLYHGRIDDHRNPTKVTSNDLTDALEKLLAGKELTLTEPRAFGCTIKRVSND